MSSDRREIFKSDWKTEFENFKLSIKFASKKLKVFLAIVLPAYFIADLWLLLQGNVFSLLYLLWPIVYMVAQCKPKEYKVIFRGILINNQLYTWKNVKGYVKDGEKIRIVMHNNNVVTLPVEAEEILLIRETKGIKEVRS